MKNKKKIITIIIFIFLIILLIFSIRSCQKNVKEKSSQSTEETSLTTTKTSSSDKKKDKKKSDKKELKSTNKEVVIIENRNNGSGSSTSSLKNSSTKPTSSSNSKSSSSSSSNSTSDSKPDNKVYAFETEFKANYLKWSNLQAQGLIEEREYTTDMDEVAKSFRTISKETEKKKNQQVLTKKEKELYQFYGELAKDIEDLSRNISKSKFDQADKIYEKIQNKEERFKKGETK